MLGARRQNRRASLNRYRVPPLPPSTVTRVYEDEMMMMPYEESRSSSSDDEDDDKEESDDDDAPYLPAASAPPRLGISQRSLVSCKYCGKRVYSFYLAIHERVHTGERPYKCNQCADVFSAKQRLTRHQRRTGHVGSTIGFSCNLCNYSSLSLESLNEHRTNVHSNQDNVVLDFLCEICGCLFATYSVLKKHLVEHHPPVACPDCPRRFTCLRSLVVHRNRFHVSSVSSSLGEDDRRSQCSSTATTIVSNQEEKNFTPNATPSTTPIAFQPPPPSWHQGEEASSSDVWSDNQLHPNHDSAFSLALYYEPHHQHQQRVVPYHQEAAAAYFHAPPLFYAPISAPLQSGPYYYYNTHAVPAYQEGNYQRHCDYQQASSPPILTPHTTDSPLLLSASTPVFEERQSRGPGQAQSPSSLVMMVPTPTSDTSSFTLPATSSSSSSASFMVAASTSSSDNSSSRPPSSSVDSSSSTNATTSGMRSPYIFRPVDPKRRCKFSCCFCGKRYSSENIYRRHENSRACAKFPCDICRKTFPNDSQLSQHKRWHSNDRPCKCSLCDATFIVPSHLNRHMLRMHNKRYRSD